MPGPPKTAAPTASDAPTAPAPAFVGGAYLLPSDLATALLDDEPTVRLRPALPTRVRCLPPPNTDK